MEVTQKETETWSALSDEFMFFWEMGSLVIEKNDVVWSRKSSGKQ